MEKRGLQMLPGAWGSFEEWEQLVASSHTNTPACVPISTDTHGLAQHANVSDIVAASVSIQSTFRTFFFFPFQFKS